MRAYLSFLSWLGQLYRSTVAAVICSMMVLLLVLMCLQVLFRYGFNDSIIWAEEVCRYLLIWASFLACGIAYDRGEIATLNLLGGVLPARIAAAVTVLADLLVLGLLGVLVVYGWRYAQFNSDQPVPAIQFVWRDLFGTKAESDSSIFWIYLAVPVGMALLAGHVAVHIILAVITIVTGRSPEPHVMGSEE